MKKYILPCFLAAGLGFGVGGWLATDIAAGILARGEACRDYQIELQSNGRYGIYDGSRFLGEAIDAKEIEALINEDEE